MTSLLHLLAVTAASTIGSGPVLAMCSSPHLVEVGATTGDKERDSVGLLCADPDVRETGVVGWERRIDQVGQRTGEAEKDTFGYVRGEVD